MTVTVKNQFDAEVRTFNGVKSISIKSMPHADDCEDYYVLEQTSGIYTYVDTSLCEISCIKPY